MENTLFKIGDRVYVMREYDETEKTFGDVWMNEEMNPTVGLVGEVVDVSTDRCKECGWLPKYKLKFGEYNDESPAGNKWSRYYWYPESVLALKPSGLYNGQLSFNFM